MATKDIRSVRFDGLTTLAGARVELRRLNVLVGANGVGKSNFVNALELLGRVADDDLQLYVNLVGGASRLLREGKPRATAVTLDMETDSVRYVARLGRSADDEFVFELEDLAWSSPDGLASTSLGGGGRSTRLGTLVDSTDEAHVAAASTTLDAIRGCRVYHFHDTSSAAAMKAQAPTADNLTLRPHAENLAALLLALRETQSAIYRRIVGSIQLVAPFFRDFVLQPERPDTIRLRWRPTDSDAVFSAHQMSDGTLRYICLVTLLLQPVRPRLIVLDEPELGLHPFAIGQLADMLRAASVNGQVVVSTQSVTLLDQMDLDDVIVVELEKGASTFQRPNREDLQAWLGEYSMGDVWLKNLIGGRPRQG